MLLNWVDAAEKIQVRYPNAVRNADSRCNRLYYVAHIDGYGRILPQVAATRAAGNHRSMARSAGWRSSLLLAPAVPPPKRTGEIGQPKFARRFLGTFYVKIANPDVHLSASPLEEYIEAFQRAIENAQLLLEELSRSQRRSVRTGCSTAWLPAC